MHCFIFEFSFWTTQMQSQSIRTLLSICVSVCVCESQSQVGYGTGSLTKCMCHTRCNIQGILTTHTCLFTLYILLIFALACITHTRHVAYASFSRRHIAWLKSALSAEDVACVDRVIAAGPDRIKFFLKNEAAGRSDTVRFCRARRSRKRDTGRSVFSGFYRVC